MKYANLSSLSRQYNTTFVYYYGSLIILFIGAKASVWAEGDEDYPELPSEVMGVLTAEMERESRLIAMKYGKTGLSGTSFS